MRSEWICDIALLSEWIWGCSLGAWSPVPVAGHPKQDAMLLPSYTTPGLILAQPLTSHMTLRKLLILSELEFSCVKEKMKFMFSNGTVQCGGRYPHVTVALKMSQFKLKCVLGFYRPGLGGWYFF